MKLDKKKKLAAKVLGVGLGRIWFNPARLTDIKEAITKQDIKDLVKDKVIKIKAITGKLKKQRRKRRREGKIKKRVKKRKKDYVKRIRKLRQYLRFLRRNGEITSKEYLKLRRYAKSGHFVDLKHLKDYTAPIRKQGGKTEKAKTKGKIKGKKKVVKEKAKTKVKTR